MDKVVLGLSGGVDSAVAAHLLRESGLEVYGLYLDNGLPGADAAREAAASLSVPLTITDSREAMEQYVCTPLPKRISAARRRTPAFYATRRSSSAPCWTKRSASGQSTSPPGIMPERKTAPFTAGSRKMTRAICSAV